MDAECRNAQLGLVADDEPSERINRILSRFLDGYRLGDEEKEAIAHILPSPERGPRLFEGKAEDVARRLGLARKTFFVWVKHGREHGDPLPANEPALVVRWYERMKARGVFSHRCPQQVVDACGGRRIAKPEPASVVAAANPEPVKEEATTSAPVVEDIGPTGLAVEIPALEKRIAATRREIERATASGDQIEKERLDDRLAKALDTLYRLKKSEENEKLIEQRVLASVQQHLADFIPAAIGNLLHMGARLYPQVQSQLPRTVFLEIYGAQLREAFKGLRECRFAPPLEGELGGLHLAA